MADTYLPEEEGRGWMLLPQEAVPDRWRSRIIPLALVPLFPEEASMVLAGEPAAPAIDSTDQRIASLAAAGRSLTEIAREVRLSVRSVQNRLARLRRRAGAATTAELRAMLASQGFEGLHRTGRRVSQEGRDRPTNKHESNQDLGGEG